MEFLLVAGHFIYIKCLPRSTRPCEREVGPSCRDPDTLTKQGSAACRRTREHRIGSLGTGYTASQTAVQTTVNPKLNSGGNVDARACNRNLHQDSRPHTNPDIPAPGRGWFANGLSCASVVGGGRRDEEKENIVSGHVTPPYLSLLIQKKKKKPYLSSDSAIMRAPNFHPPTAQRRYFRG